MEHGRKFLIVPIVMLIGACTAKTPESVTEIAASPSAATQQSAAESAPKDNQHDQPSNGDTSMLRSSYGECIKASGGVVPDMQACIEEEFDYQDARLNNVYRRLLETSEGSKKIELESSQKQWLAERDSKCGWDAGEEGQGQRIEANDCFLEMTAKRAGELEAMAG